MLKDRFSYLKPLLKFMGIGLAIMTLSRLVIFFLYFGRLSEVENWGYMFTLGFRMDWIVICYLSFLPALIVTFIPDAWNKFTSKFMCIYGSIFLFLILFMEVVTPEFIDQYDTRPNKLFLEYLIYPKEIFTMLMKARPLKIILMAVIFGLVIWGMTKVMPKVFKAGRSPYLIKLLVFPLLGFLLFWGARGSLTTRRPINASNSVFSNDQLANVMGVNSLYTVAYSGYSLRHEVNPAKLYGKMDSKEAIERVKKYMTVAPECFTDTIIPLLHTQKTDSILERPLNVVVFLQESLGAEYVGCLGGLPLTPNLDNLAKEGLLFTNLYCTGTRSVRGIEAVVTGFLPSPSESVVKLSNSQRDFFTLAQLFKNEGYNTSFHYGGMANFDNMASFFNGNGFDNIVDETAYESDGKEHALKGTWGYSDEDLVEKANDYFKGLGDKPFFSLMFSSSNHEPFEFPEGRFELYEQPQATVHNAMKYADFAIGKFFELAKKEDYFKNTLFIVVADHNTRTYGKNLVPIHKFHIPALIVAPNVEKGSTFGRLCSQIDLGPTMLNLAGLNVETPMPGRDLMNFPDSVEGRSIMQFHDINAFRVENRVVIMQPQTTPKQFVLTNDTTMTEVDLDPEFAKDALGHVAAADYMYRERKYNLRTGNGQ